MPSAITPSIKTAPVWRDCHAMAGMKIPLHWQRWLLDRGSLTRHLMAASQGAFRVGIIQQRVLRPQFSEQTILKMTDRSLALVREVVLYGNDQPWVFARSVLPLTTLTGRQRRLRKLDNRPLGALLFADPGMRRGAIQVSRINPGQLPLSGILEPEMLDHSDSCLGAPSALSGDNGALSDSSALWGRRSVFYLDSKPLLVSEVFLPNFGPCRAYPYNKPSDTQFFSQTRRYK